MSGMVPSIRILSVGTYAQTHKAILFPEGEPRAEQRRRTTTAEERRTAIAGSDERRKDSSAASVLSVNGEARKRGGIWGIGRGGGRR